MRGTAPSQRSDRVNARLKEAGERGRKKEGGGNARHRHLENLIKPREEGGEEGDRAAIQEEGCKKLAP